MWSRFSSPSASRRLFQHGGVHLEADCFDVAALLATQHVAGAAQFQSSAAILNPAPRSENSFSAARRRLATSVNSCSGESADTHTRAGLERPNSSAQ